MEAHGKNKRGSEGGDEDFSVLNEFKGLAEKCGKSVHGVGLRYVLGRPRLSRPRPSAVPPADHLS